MSYEELLTKLALEDDRFVVMTAENRALVRNLPAKLGKRFVDTGITEQTMVGAAAGLALRGRIPVLHALATFLSMRAFEFIRTDAGIPNLPVKLSSFIPGFLSDGNGPTHQAIEDISIMRGIPNVTVFAAADEQDLVGMLPTIWHSPNPAYVRINTRPGTYNHTPFEIGKAEVVAEGADVTILTYGLLFEQALIATQILKDHGLSVGLINMRSLKPVDEQAILKAAQTSNLLVTLEDHFNTGGLYSIVAETLLKHQTTAKVMPYGLDGKWFKPALLPAVLEYEGFTGKQIAEKILGYTTNAVQPVIATPEFAE
ncbi:transketolase family protein [Mucilaginibacter paludis]|uniref:1-deoxy-D-xylulose-5-phosphate synthase n=1 Tax=Mucilaginibacter paludis DSM 18603 TaxID=714943 RepID=H1Y9P9_9SPHI|nr:transketolase C-terminal domain-containing protein [Mucilaginibacter paludis]EHQ30551.1 Transketolase central region [Mucilaginibacter paludis DSM 18603]